jgi:hypothetical protein
VDTVTVTPELIVTGPDITALNPVGTVKDVETEFELQISPAIVIPPVVGVSVSVTSLVLMVI